MTEIMIAFCSYLDLKTSFVSARILMFVLENALGQRYQSPQSCGGREAGILP